MNIERPTQLLEYLQSTERIAPDEQPDIQKLAGGVSNRTILLERPCGESWVLKQALEKLRVPIEWKCPPDRIYREALGLRWLEQLVPSGMVPRFIFEDREQYLLAMEAVPKPHENWKTMLLGGELYLEHVEIFARLLASIHLGGYDHASEIDNDLRDWTFFEELRLDPYYAYTATEVSEAADFLHELVRKTRERKITLVHGDFSPKNILIHDDRPVLLDHEVIHFGDPAFDLGFSMTHLLSKAHHVRERRRGFLAATRRYWKIYYGMVKNTEWSRDLETHTIGHTLGCLLARVAGKSQLEYMSQDERERQQEAVTALIRNCPTTIPALVYEFHQEIERRE